MLENDLRQLQRLGIDIWVSPKRARELIAAGRANLLLEVDATQSSTTPRERPSRSRSWDHRKQSETSKSATTEASDVRGRPDPSSGSPAAATETVTPKPFNVQLKVYLYGPVAVVVERSVPCPDVLISDILRALSGFKDHQLNELHFGFPLVGSRKNESSLATLAGAQEGFQAWFEQRSPNCESVLLIGSPASDTAARLNEKISRTISISEVPISRDGKQELWNLIKNLNV